MAKREWWRKLFRKWGVTALSAGSLGAAAASGVVEGNLWLGSRFVPWPAILIAVAVALFLIQGFIQRRQLKEVESLDSVTADRDAAEAGILKAIRLELVRLQTAAHLYSSDRISLFRCEAGHFILIGRRSAQPEFEQSLRRETYPLNQGCLGAAWAQGTSEEPGLPDPGDGAEPRPGWLQAQERRWGIPRDTSKQFKMWSQSYVAFRIDHLDHFLGVLVAESELSEAEANQAGTDPRLTIGRLKPLLDLSSPRLADLLKASQAISPERVAQLLPEIQGVPQPRSG